MRLCSHCYQSGDVFGGVLGVKSALLQFLLLPTTAGEIQVKFSISIIAFLFFFLEKLLYIGPCIMLIKVCIIIKSNKN